MIPRGRLLKRVHLATRQGEDSAPTRRAPVDAEATVRISGQVVPRGTLVKSVLAEARLEAAATLERAREQARQTIASARVEAEEAVRSGYEEARARALAELVTAFVRLREEEAQLREREVDRVVDLARILAERILGEAIALDPSRIVALARQTLLLVRQARKVALRAHPEDAARLSEKVADLGLEEAALTIHVDESRPRGSLLLESDLGLLDADVSIQLDRLVAAIRETAR